MNKYIRDENTGVFKQSVGTTGADQVVNNARSGRSVGYNPPEDRSLQQHLNGTDDTQSTYDMWSGMNPNIDDLVNQAYPQKHSVGSNIASMLAAAATGFAAGYTGDPSVYNNYMEELNYPKHQREQLRSSLIADQYKSQMPTSDMREFAAYAGKNIEPGSDEWQKLWDRFKHPTSEYDLYYKDLRNQAINARIKNIDEDNIARDEGIINSLMKDYKNNTTELLPIITAAKNLEQFISLPEDPKHPGIINKFSFDTYNPSSSNILIPQTPQKTIFGYTRPNPELDKKVQAFEQAMSFLENPAAVKLFGKQIPPGGEGQMLYNMLQKGNLKDPVLRVKAAKYILDNAMNEWHQSESGLEESPFGAEVLKRILKSGGKTYKSLSGGKNEPPLDETPNEIKAKALEVLKRKKARAGGWQAQ